MNQKEARALGLCFGSSNAQKVLKRIKDYVLWSEYVSDADRRDFDRALLVMSELGLKYEAIWEEQWRRRQDARRLEQAARSAGAPQ